MILYAETWAVKEWIIAISILLGTFIFAYVWGINTEKAAQELSRGGELTWYGKPKKKQ